MSFLADTAPPRQSESASVSVESTAAIGGSTSVRVQTDTFEGPFDVLLHLILKDEVNLYEVSLFDIVDAYLAEIERMDFCDLELSTEFLLIAATLVELKCRRLLPIDDSVDLDDELGLWEERDLLLSRLLECKTFKDAAKIIDQLSMLGSLTVARRVGLEEQFLALTPDMLIGVKPEQIRNAFLKAVAPKPKPEVTLLHVTDVRVSVADAIEELVDELPRSGPVTFRAITAGLGDKLEVVVRFLAVLELFKQGLVELDQPNSFGDLTVEWIGGEIGRELALSGADLYEG